MSARSKAGWYSSRLLTDTFSVSSQAINALPSQTMLFRLASAMASSYLILLLGWAIGGKAEDSSPAVGGDILFAAAVQRSALSV
jgi:hypothetical protein